MMEIFKSNKTNKYLNRWLNHHPESYHTTDIENFYEFLISLFEEEGNEELTHEILEKCFTQKGFSMKAKEIAENYMSRYHTIRKFYFYYISNNRRIIQ